MINATPRIVGDGSGGGGGGPVTGLTGTPTQVVYIDNSGNGTGDAYFTRDSVTNETLIGMIQNGGLDEAGLAIKDDIFGLPGTDGVAMRRGDVAGTVGNAVLAVFDATPFGAGRFAILGTADDVVTGETGQLVVLPTFGSINTSKATGESANLQLNSGDTANLFVDNANGGGNDFAGIIADLNGGGGTQFIRGRYQDGTNDWGWSIDNNGIKFDFDGFSGNAGTFYYFPTADATVDGQVLTGHADGTTTWETPASPSAPLTDTYIGFGDPSNLLTGSGNFTYGSTYSFVTHTTPNNSDSLTYSGVGFTGSGLNDLTLTWNSGVYTSLKYGGNLQITIDTTGTPDTFTWIFTGGYSQVVGSGTSVPITGGLQTLSDNDGQVIALIQFGATTGHTFNDRWNAATSLGGSQKGYLLKDNLNHEFFVSNSNGGAYKLGDDGTNGGSSWWGNGTLLEIQDNSGVMYLDVPNDLFIESPGSGGYQVGHFDMQNREVQFGDLDIVGNKTRFAISDPSNTVYITADGSNAFTIYNANYDEQYFAVSTLSGGAVTFGDLSGVNNSSTFTFSDATSRAIFSLDDQFNIRSAASTSRYYFNAGYNGGNPIINFGAPTFGNGTVFSLNDQNQVITAYAQTFIVENPGGNKFINIDSSNNLYEFGDTDNLNNNSYVYIDDTNEKFAFASNGTDHFIAYKDWTFLGGAVVHGSIQAYTSTGSVSINDNVSTLQYNPASVNATATITLPATSGGSGSIVTVVFGGTITSGNPVVTTLTWAAGSGNTLVASNLPATANAGDSVSFEKIGTYWYQIN